MTPGYARSQRSSRTGRQSLAGRADAEHAVLLPSEPGLARPGYSPCSHHPRPWARASSCALLSATGATKTTGSRRCSSSDNPVVSFLWFLAHTLGDGPHWGLASPGVWPLSAWSGPVQQVANSALGVLRDD